MLFMYGVRSLFLYILVACWTTTFVLFCCCFVYPFFSHEFYRDVFVVKHSIVFIWLCRIICGIDWVVEGQDNIPEKSCVVVSNHQSTWETLFFHVFFNPQSIVLKKELLKIPMFGLGLSKLKPIAIDRSNPKQALRQLLEQGKKVLDRNHRVFIFPEGTRTVGSKLGEYSHGAAMLAKKEKVQILPVIHTAGECWPNNSWIKKPGQIKVCIGLPIDVEGQSIKAITQQVMEVSQKMLSKQFDAVD